MELAAADTAYEKDRQIEILKHALNESSAYLSNFASKKAFDIRMNSVNAIISADKIEQEWRTEDK